MKRYQYHTILGVLLYILSYLAKDSGLSILYSLWGSISLILGIAYTFKDKD